MIFISNILFNLQLFDIYDAKIQYFFRIILLSHEKSAFRGIFLTIQGIFWNKKHTPKTQYRITSQEIHSNIFSHFCIKMVYEISTEIFTLFSEISTQFIRSDKAQGCKTLTSYAAVPTGTANQRSLFAILIGISA